MVEALESEGFRDAMALPSVRDKVTELVGEDVFSERIPAKKILDRLPISWYISFHGLIAGGENPPGSIEL
jgi:hypothetical protein